MLLLLFALASVGHAWALPATLLTVADSDPAPAGMEIAVIVGVDQRPMVTLLNMSPTASIALDWQQSTVILPGGRSTGLVPGWIIRSHGDSVIAPSVAPASARVTEVLYRRDEISIHDPAEAMMDAGEIGGATVDIVFRVDDGPMQHWRSHLLSVVNPAVARAAADAYREQVEAQQRAREFERLTRLRSCNDQAERYRRYAHRWGIWAAVGIGGGGAGTVGLTAYEVAEIGHPDKQDEASSFLALAVVAMGTGIAFDFISWKQSHNAKALHCERI